MASGGKSDPTGDLVETGSRTYPAGGRDRVVSHTGQGRADWTMPKDGPRDRVSLFWGTAAGSVVPVFFTGVQGIRPSLGRGGSAGETTGDRTAQK